MEICNCSQKTLSNTLTFETVCWIFEPVFQLCSGKWQFQDDIFWKTLSSYSLNSINSIQPSMSNWKYNIKYTHTHICFRFTDILYLLKNLEIFHSILITILWWLLLIFLFHTGRRGGTDRLRKWSKSELQTGSLGLWKEKGKGSEWKHCVRQ